MRSLALHVSKKDERKEKHSLITADKDSNKQSLAVDLHHISKLYYTPSTPPLESAGLEAPKAILYPAPLPAVTPALRARPSARPLIAPGRDSSLQTLPSVPFDKRDVELSHALADFAQANPQYRASLELDRVRRLYYRRLDETGQVYLDYTGGSLYPSHLIDWHHALLSRGVFGNPHSQSPSSLLSTTHERAARLAVLEFLDADADEYEVIFTPNATGGLKIVTENYQFKGKRLVVAVDSHNSVNGMVCTARKAGGVVDMVQLEEGSLTVDSARMENVLRTKPDSDPNPGLVFFTGQSNVTGAKAKPWWFGLAREHGWHTGLDASALAPTTPISLRQNPVDFLVISVYKIIGYPTGVGALVLRKDARKSLLVRSSFTGGTVDAIDPVDSRFRLYDGPSAFEDGTINYLALPAVAEGLAFVKPLLTTLSWRLQTLVEYLWRELPEIRYDNEAAGPLVELRGPPPGPERGATLSLLFYAPESSLAPYKFVVWAAARQNISVRGGPCLCNPGAATGVMRGVGFEDWEKVVTAQSGIIRISLGIASNFDDCFKFLSFCRQLATASYYQQEHSAWRGALEQERFL